MRVGVISDVHGNLPALAAVLGDLRREALDAVISCGDVAAGPLPGPTIDLLRRQGLPLHGVRGNADRGMLGAFDGTAGTAAHEDDLWAGSQLDADQRDFLASFSPTLSLEVDGLGPVLFCHGTPRRDDEIVLESSTAERFAKVLDDVRERTVVCGHTHMQFDRRVDGSRVVNVGSVGMPYGGTGAYWALLGPDVVLRRTEYDLEAAAEEIRRTSRWPKAAEFVAENVLRVPSAAAALAYFTRLESESGP